MELDILVRSGQRPLTEANITLSSWSSKTGIQGPAARFAGLAAGIYKLEAKAEGHYPRYLTIALGKSRSLELELKERK